MVFYHPIEQMFPYTGGMGEIMNRGKTPAPTAAEAEALAVVENFVPQSAPAEVWESHGHLVRDRVRAVKTKGPRSAQTHLSAGAGLLAFAAREGIPLRGEVVFSDEVIERYVAAELTGSRGSRGTTRSRLRRLRDAYAPEQTPVVDYQRVRPPYTIDELAGLWRMVSNQSTPYRTRRLQALYCLCVGAGCDATDLRTVSGEDVYKDNGLVYVAIGEPRVRTVPVLGSVGPTLLGLAETAGKEMVIGGNADDHNLVNRLVRSATGGEDLPRLNVARLRHSWMVAMANARLPLTLLADMAGVATLRTFEDLLPYTNLPPGEVTEAYDFEMTDALELGWL